MAEREDPQAERERQDAEKMADIKARQIRLGHVEAPEPENEEKEKKSSSRSRTSSKKKT
jgi:hypothetical protein